MPALLALASGLLTGLSLIVVIGAQNAFVLRQGLTGRHVLPVVLVCALSDAALIAAGVLGFGAATSRVPGLTLVATLGGAAFLAWHAVAAVRRALSAAGVLDVTGQGAGSLRAALLACLGFTWLNPHVYLDTLVLLGSVASGYGHLRWWFGAGAATASLAWFGCLGFGAALLRPLFTRPTSWRVLDTVVAAVLALTAVGLIVQAVGSWGGR